MSADARALFRPKKENKEKLEGYITLYRRKGAPSVGPEAEELPDGSFLVDTDLPFASFEDGWGIDEFLGQFSKDDLPLLHDDPDGLFVFPEDLMVPEVSYEEVLAVVGDHGVWIELVEEALDEETKELVQAGVFRARPQRGRGSEADVAHVRAEPCVDEGTQPVDPAMERLFAALDSSYEADDVEPPRSSKR